MSTGDVEGALAAAGVGLGAAGAVGCVFTDAAVGCVLAEAAVGAGVGGLVAGWGVAAGAAD